ncbi:MAG: hypothetical protein KAI24_19240 [Planctomycetes bacterium]|nr:hypothetical protein [Planctomycetota bacterium]
MADKADKREPNGRFAKGNPGGPGRPKGRGFELQRAAQEAVTPEHIQGIIRKATMQALKGDIVAARLVLDRTCGRSPDPAPQAEALGVELPKLATAADCAAALDLVAAALCEGRCDRTAAKLLADLVMTRLKAIEVQDLEERLSQLEQSAAVVEPGAARRL